MEVKFEIDADKVGEDLKEALCKTILGEKLKRSIENAAYEMAKDWEKHIGDSLKWSMQSIANDILQSDEFKPKLENAIKKALDKKIDGLAEEAIQKININRY